MSRLPVKKYFEFILVARCAMKWLKKKLQRRLVAQSAIILAGTSERGAQIRF
jgi:hypothetical protein